MSRLVLKFGGSSLKDLDHIRRCAQHVKREHDDGHSVAVVVSAQGDTTDHLLASVEEISDKSNGHDGMGYFDAREYDAVVSAGEQISAGLMALALQSVGVPARSWLGWQCPVITNNFHGKARVLSIECESMLKQMKDTKTVAVLAGFQGLSDKGRITTLGRDGSDTSAVLLAAALNAKRCDIYTDVPGVFDADPRLCQNASVIERITYEEMLELASLGADVLQARCVIAAMRHKIKLGVRSAFDDPNPSKKRIALKRRDFPGTLLVEEQKNMEQPVVTAIAHTNDEALITIVEVNNTPGISSALFGPLGDLDMSVDMIIQTTTPSGEKNDINFTVSREDVGPALKSIKANRDKIGYKNILSKTDVAKVSIVGIGMQNNSGVAGRMFKALADKGINILAISTSEIKVSVLILEEYVELAVRALHAEFKETTPTAPKASKLSFLKRGKRKPAAKGAEKSAAKTKRMSFLSKNSK